MVVLSYSRRARRNGQGFAWVLPFHALSEVGVTSSVQFQCTVWFVIGAVFSMQVWSLAWVSSSLIRKAFDTSCWWCKLWVHRWLASRVFLGHIYLLRSRISSFDPPFLNVVQGFWQLGLLGAIFLPISTGSFGFSVIGTADPSSDKSP